MLVLALDHSWPEIWKPSVLKNQTNFGFDQNWVIYSQYKFHFLGFTVDSFIYVGTNFRDFMKKWLFRWYFNSWIGLVQKRF